MAVAIVTDTCHYLPRDLIEAQGIREVSLYLHWDGETQRESDITNYDAYYERLRTAPELPSTSQPSIGDFLATYEPLLRAGDDVVSIHLAGGMSGTVHAAEQAREQLGKLAGRVHVVDSESACGGEGLVVLAAAAAARAGADAPGVVGRAHHARAHLRLWFAIDTLDYLRRGGRIGGAQAWLGSALQIKPILTVESVITPVERVRTSRRAFERLVELLRTRARDGADAWVIQHIQAYREAEELARLGQEMFKREPLVVSQVGPVIGAHVGPGLLGACGIPASLI